ncbi:MAG: UPF0223 family protein [Deltaproteobacteria bacterium]|jgi:hypothetical protein|nr:UPF0223 family protein [Deltaproteobacteria bacterium]
MTQPLHPEQIRIFRSMTPEQKLRLASRLHYSARQLKASALRHQHPDWSEEEIADVTREIFFNAGT